MSEIVDYGYLDTIYNNLSNYIPSVYGVCALMGNLYAESMCTPNRKQGDNNGYPTEMSLNYTAEINSLSYSRNEFINDSIGYSLAQWTIGTRKKLYYDYQSVVLVSIGDIDRALGYLKAELEGDYSDEGVSFGDTLNILQTATLDNVLEVSDIVCDVYCNPAIKNYDERRDYTQQFINRYSANGYLCYAEISGNGTCNITPSIAQEGEEVRIVCIPAEGETLVDIEGRLQPSGYSYVLEFALDQTILMPSSDLLVKVTFTGEPPVPPPILRTKNKKYHTPIWLYPIIRRKL